MKIGRTAVAAMLAIAMLVSHAVAQVEVIEEIPATRQTPRGTLKLLRQAMEAADGEALRSILVGQTPQEKRMVEAMVQTAESVQRLRQAAVEAFGEAAARELVGGPVDPAEAMKEIDTASETIQENSAIVRFTDVLAEPVKLVLEGEQWHVPVGELAQGLQASELEQRIAEVQVFAEVMSQITEEIRQQKFSSAEQAAQALYNRMMQAMTRLEVPAEAPAMTPAAVEPEAPATTQPAETPAPATTQPAE
mgnify:FL=1